MEICFLVHIMKINEQEFGIRRYYMELIGADIWPTLFVTFFQHFGHCYALAMQWLPLAGHNDDVPTRRPGFSLNDTL